MILAMAALLPTAARHRAARYLALAVIGVVLRAVGIVLLVPLVTRLFGSDPSSAWPWVGLLALATATGWLVDASVAHRGFDLGFTVMQSTQQAVADGLQQVSLGWFDAEHTATARRAASSDGPALVGLVVYLLTPLIGAVLLPLAIGLTLLPISWPVGLAALGGVPVLLGAFWSAVAISRGADREAARENTRLTERLIEFARTQPVLRAARRASPERSMAGAALTAQHRSGMRLLRWQIPAQLLFSVATQIALLLLAGTTAALAVHGSISSLQAIALIAVMARYLEPFTALNELSATIESTSGMLTQIRTILDAPRPKLEGTAPRTNRAPVIELADVDFSYGTDAPVLSGLSLRLSAGTTTAIVGPSGSGKSTLLALIAGLHQPTRGRVLVAGADLGELAPTELHGLRSVVFQHPYLFDGSIRDNILVGNPSATTKQLTSVVQRARVAEIIANLPQGLDSRVGEAGTALSGGERQRVSIARALLMDAPVLLVDEGTSALDTENESAIVEALATGRRKQTRVVVSHRLASIRIADRVLFLEDGCIVEDGSVDELLAAGGRLATFWREQEATTRWQLGRPKPSRRPAQVATGKRKT